VFLSFVGTAAEVPKKTIFKAVNLSIPHIYNHSL